LSRHSVQSHMSAQLAVSQTMRWDEENEPPTTGTFYTEALAVPGSTVAAVHTAGVRLRMACHCQAEQSVNVTTETSCSSCAMN